MKMTLFKRNGTPLEILRTLALAALFVRCLAGPVHASPALVREANTTLNFPAVPPSGSYSSAAGVGEFNFVKPVAVATPPGETNRIFVVERLGRIIVVTNLALPTETVFLDIRDRVAGDYDTKKVEGLTSLAFHPGFQTNGLFYVTYTTVTASEAGVGNHNRLSEFRCSPTDPNAAMADSEVPFITQFDRGDGHNFNDSHFGPDGYLYVSMGDEGDGGTGDDFNNAQRIDKNYFSGIIRIDPDKRPGNPIPNPHPANTMNYAVPADNPFLGLTNFQGKLIDPGQIRTEFFAIGLRNPWRFSFDPVTSTIYEGDVGQHSREEVNIIVKGGNYGWSFKEGTLPGPKAPVPRGLTVTDPIWEYSPGLDPTHGYCVIGGVVYRGERFPQLYGAYIFADYVSGNIWALRYDGKTASAPERLMYLPEVAGFGYDPSNGDVLMINHEGGRIWRLVYNPAPGSGPLPETLADTGIFSDPEKLTVNPGIVPYDVNVPLWSDNAKKQRWFSVPNLSKTIGFDAEGNWNLPEGTVWVKHFELELTQGDPASAKRVETRALVKTSQGVYGVTYRWGDSKTNATLVPDTGLTENFVIQDGATTRTQVWNYPSRSDCLACHTPVGGFALGFNTPQFNRDFQYGSVLTNQIAALDGAGYFAAPAPDPRGLRALAGLGDETASREYRVHSYLTANCVFCHQPGGSAHATWDARITTPIDLAGIINGPLYANLGNPDNRVIKPGSVELSMMLKRLSYTIPEKMPPLATTIPNQQAYDLIAAWVAQDLPARETFADWQTRLFGGASPVSAAPAADPDGDGIPNYTEFLTGSDPLDSNDRWGVSAATEHGSIAVSFSHLANRAFLVESSPSLLAPDWKILDDPANKLDFPASARTQTFREPADTSSRFYRVRVLSP